ncbi:MAG: hypothetical protein M1831_003350 [Alyxoria varia]|nr:MAG: hypothetical protein M1831_003350 [Alyxoria varia]
MAPTQDLRSSILFEVKGYVCVVTGGGTGIGLFVLASPNISDWLMTFGKHVCSSIGCKRAKVYIVGRRREALEAAAVSHTPENGEIIPCSPCDVRKKDELDKLVQEIEAKEKQVHLLVTSAGIPGPKAEPDTESGNELKSKLWNNESVEAWNDVYDADVTSVYFTTVAFLPLLQSASQSNSQYTASVITISSMSGLIRGSQGHFSYNAAKGATIQLTRLMSSEFLKAGIRINSIAPGYFPSELTAQSSGPDQKSELPDSYVQEKNHVPLQRPGDDQEMAQTVLFLAKNQYVTGQIIAVEGGVLNVMPGG